MSDPAWPSHFPLPLLEGYGGQHSLPLQRTQMESGPDRIHRTSSTYNTTVSGAFMLTKAQYAEWVEFFNVQCNAGANYITLPLDTAGGVAHHRVRITSWQYALVPPFYKITCTIETEERITAWV